MATWIDQINMPKLHAVCYHYIRDFKNTKYPRIHGMELSDFERQVDELQSRYEMASYNSMMDFLSGTYIPKKDLCLLTFDDGLKEHAHSVTHILARRKIPGFFFLITSGIQEKRVAQVHKNHFLLASLPFSDYKNRFLKKLLEEVPQFDFAVDPIQVKQTYRWDDPDVAAFKFILNFRVPDTVRSKILDELFQETFGDEREFAKELYLNWNEAKNMQKAGMILGGHSHNHVALSTLTPEQQTIDLDLCFSLLKENIGPGPFPIFSYPYGKSHTYTPTTVTELKKHGVLCSFATEVGSNNPRDDAFSLRRIDPKEVAKL